MAGQVPEIACAVCNKPLNLDARVACADENGRAVHTECYLGPIVKTAKPSSGIPPQPKA